MLTYICHAYSADPAANCAKVKEICRIMAKDGYTPVAPQIYLPQFVDEATERDLAMRLCMSLVRFSEQVFVFGAEAPSAGMKEEMKEARWRGIPMYAARLERLASGESFVVADLEKPL